MILFPDAPRVELALGVSITPDSIYEGGDVYFDCRIEAQPPPTKITWQFNVSALVNVGKRVNLAKNNFPKKFFLRFECWYES